LLESDPRTPQFPTQAEQMLPLLQAARCPPGPPDHGSLLSYRKTADEPAA